MVSVVHGLYAAATPSEQDARVGYSRLTRQTVEARHARRARWARTRDLRSHKWVVGARGAVEARLWRVRECPDEGGLQCACSTVRGEAKTATTSGGCFIPAPTAPVALHTTVPP